MGPLKIAVDWINKTLVSVSGSVVTLPPLYQRDIQRLQIQLVEPSGDPTAPYTVLEATDLVGVSPRVTISQKATGIDDDETDWVLAQALETEFAWDEELIAFVGDLNLNTAEMAAFIAAASSKSCLFEIRVAVDGKISTIYQTTGQFTVRANADVGGNPALTIIGGSISYDLPVNFRSATGYTYSLMETGPGVLGFVVVGNPP